MPFNGPTDYSHLGMSLACDFCDLGFLSRFIPNRVEDNVTHFCFLHSHRSPNLPFRQHAIDINMNLAIRLSPHRPTTVGTAALRDVARASSSS